MLVTQGNAGSADDGFVSLSQEDLGAGARARAVLDLADLAVLVRDLDSRVRYVNPAAERLYGFTREEAEGQVSHALLRTAFPLSLGTVERILERDGVWEGPLVHTCRDGRVIIVHSHQVLQRDPSGGPVAIVEWNRALTPREEAFTVVADPEPPEDRLFIFQAIRDARGRLVDTRLEFAGGEPEVFEPRSPGRSEGSSWWPGLRETVIFELVGRVLDQARPIDFADLRVEPPWADEERVLAGRAAPFGTDAVALRVRDITVERRALQQLDDAQARVRLALASAPIAVYQTDSEGVIEWVGGSIGRAASDPDSLVGKHAPIGPVGDDLVPFREAMARVLATGRDEHFEVRLSAPSPPYAAVMLRARRALDGRINGLIISAHDISEYKRVQEELLESQATLRAVTDNTDDAVWLNDLDGRILYLNRRCADFLNTAPREAIGRSFFDVMPHAAASQSQAQNQAVIATSSALSFEQTVRGPDGALHHFLVRRFPVAGPDGRITAVGAIASDVTAQRDADAAMRLQATAMSRAAEGIVVVRVGDERIVQANERYCELFGYAPGQLDGQRVTILNAPGADDASEDVHREIVHHLEEQQGEATMRVHNVRRDGECFWTEAHITPFDHPEHGPCWVAVQRDISEQVELEGRVAEAEARAGAALEELSACRAQLDAARAER